jgi:cold shock CspA family protein
MPKRQKSIELLLCLSFPGQPCDGGGKDVFLHITALRRSGVSALDPGQRVRVEVVDGKKGLEAERITLI